MALHGQVLAASHRLSASRGSDALLKRLAQNETLLAAVRALLTEAVNDDRRITPAGEWLLDNFYLIEEQIRTARRHLPAGYSRELPRLAAGPSAGLPRVYDLALETISHGDGRLDTDGLGGFVSAYQSVTPLTIGELWAIPIMVRLALIENLRRVAARIGADRMDRNRADFWADQMTAIAVKDPKSLILSIADMARSDPPMVGSFVAEFARRLQGKSAALALPLTWIEQRLSEDGLTIEQLVQQENQHQAADQVSISNSISSLRFLGAADWRTFVETKSGVERALREDPAGVYALMDFATRDHYRHVVETTARRSGRTETEVAGLAIDLARQASATAGPDATTRHVGYYLAGAGRAQLDRAAGARLSIGESARRWCLRHPLTLYGGSVTALTLAPAAALVMRARSEGVEGWLLGLAGLLLLVCASQVAIAVVNAVVPLLATPRALPKMDLSEGIPGPSRTLVVVPSMITSTENVERLVEALEVRYLGNRDDHVAFALLTDLADAPRESLPEDEALERLAGQRIGELNAKYGPSFFLFHRPRRWNPAERVWMGYERKRGKLADLNALLRGRADGRFSLVIGDTSILPQVKYVITLDADTQLPRDAARLMVGAMMHPLNRARYDQRRQRVTEGYGILQPRVAVSLPGANRSHYARLWASDPGIDPYTRVVSDVYQDLFDEGSFIGKGIYDVDAFNLAVGGRFPENRILSHDLLEGCYARAGLLTDVQVYEEYPSRYDEDVRRRYRWIRGDWQLWRWVLPGAPGPDGRRSRNPLPALCRWKLLDNLRRSLAPAALTAMLLVVWARLSPAWAWTLVGVGSLLLPALIASLPGLVRKPDDVALGRHLEASARSIGLQFVQAMLTLACLPYEAYFSLDAALRTLGRTVFTRRRLLEWTPSADRAHPAGQGLAGAWATMWVAPALAVVVFAYLSLERPAGLAAAAPVLLLWFAAPVITWHISRPLPTRDERLTADQLRFLRGVARRTWGFFDTCVGPGDHWLPPDNFQESPAAGLAHRTSPTNMGLALLANLSAFDFGYISAGRLVTRTQNAFEAMSSMERHRGHFYNWYDTQSLAPLEPRYISSVDSGNLAGHLLTLRPGLLALPDAPILPPQTFHGLRNTLELMVGVGPVAQPAAMTRLQKALDEACDSPPATVAAGRLILDRLGAESRALAAALATASDGHDAQRWAAALAAQCADFCDDLAALAPWTSVGASAAPHVHLPGFTGNPDAHGTGGARRRVGRARSSADRVDQPPRGTDRRLRRHGVGVPVRPHTPSPVGRLQRRRSAPRFQLLRPARLRGAPRDLRRDRAGTPPAGELVLARAPAHHRRGRAGAAVVERLHVRVPDAARRHAGLRRHPARPDVQGGGEAPDRVRQAPGRALGHLGMRVQPARLAPRLPVPRIRGARPRLEARPRRRPRRGAVRVGPRADGVAGRRVREPAAPRGRGIRRGLRLLRGDRLHAGAPAAGPRARHRPLLHGAPPGDDVPVAGAGAPRRPDAGAIRLRPGVPGDGAAAPGADPARGRVLPAAGARIGRAGDAGGRRHRRACLQRARHAGPRGAAPLERPLPRRRHQRGRRVQPMEGPGRHPLARGHDVGQLGDVLLPPGCRERRLLVRGAPARPAAGGPVRGRVLRGPRRVPRQGAPDRQLHRDRRVAGRRRRIAQAAPDQLRPHAPDDRGDQLRGSGAGFPGLGRAAPGVQQSLRPDRDCPRPARHPLREAPALARRVVTLDVPSPRAARRLGRCRPFVRDGPLALPRPRQNACRPARDARDGPAVGHRRVGAGPDCRDPRAVRPRTGRVDLHRRRLRRGRDAGGVPRAGGQVPGPPARQPRVRPGLDARPGRAAAVECQRGGRATLLPPGRVHHLRQSVAARRPGRLRPQPPRAVRALGILGVGRSANRPAADRRRGEHRTGAAARAGPRLLAAQGTGRGPRHLERGPGRLPAGPSGPDHRPHRGRRRDACARPPGRHLRPPGRTDLGRGPDAVPLGGQGDRRR